MALQLVTETEKTGGSSWQRHGLLAVVCCSMYLESLIAWAPCLTMPQDAMACSFVENAQHPPLPSRHTEDGRCTTAVCSKPPVCSSGREGERGGEGAVPAFFHGGANQAGLAAKRAVGRS